MSRKPGPLSSITRHYLWDCVFRLVVTFCVGITYCLKRSWLDFTGKGVHVLVLGLLWLGVFLSMVAQLNPKTALTTGCHKQYPARYEPVSQYSETMLKEAVKKADVGALKVAVVWFGINLGFGILYHMGILGVPDLVLLCALWFLGDLVCSSSVPSRHSL